MQFAATHTYRHPADQVFETLTNFDAIKEKYEALGQSSVRLLRREAAADGTLTVVTTRVVPLELPGFAKRVLSPKQTVTQTDQWSPPDAKGRRTGTFRVEASGTPVRVFGSLRLSPKGKSACTNVTEVTVECKLPLIGGKIADVVAKDTRRAVDHEERWITDHLG